MNSNYIYERFLAPEATFAAQPERFELFHTRYGAYRPPLNFVSHDPDSYCESFPIDSGLMMLVMNVGLARTTEVRLRGQGIVEFHYRLSGSLEMRGGWGRLQMREPLMLLWRQPA